MNAARRLARLALGALVAAGGALVLDTSGRGALAPPPLGRPRRWGAWLAERDPMVASFALIRVVVVVVAAYLVACVVFGTVLRLAGSVRMVALADRLTVGPVRRLLAGAGLGVLASTGLASTGLASTGLAPTGAPLLTAAAAQPAPPPAGQDPAGLPTSLPLPATLAGAAVDDPPGTVTMRRLPAAGVAAQPPATPPPAAGPQGGPPAAPVPELWRVEPGQCFWSIADEVLRRHLGRPPTDAEIVPYWRRLIEANRHQLAHRHNPDLVFPGQTFTVPAP